MVKKVTIIGLCCGLVGPIYYQFEVLFHLDFDPFWSFPFAILTLDADLAYSKLVCWLIYIGAVLLNVAFFSAIGAGLGWIAKLIFNKK